MRAPAPRHAHVRHQPVLLRRVPVRDRPVRDHGRLEAVRPVHRCSTAGQHGRPVQGEPAGRGFRTAPPGAPPRRLPGLPPPGRASYEKF